MDATTAEAQSASRAESPATSPGPVPFAATMLPLFGCAFSILAILAHGASGDGWSVIQTAAVVAVVSWWVLRGVLLAGLAAGYITFVAMFATSATVVEKGTNASGFDVGLAVCATGAFVALLMLWHSGYVRWHKANGRLRPAQVATVVLFGAVAGALWGLQGQDAGDAYNSHSPPTHGGQSAPALTAAA